VVVMDNLSAHKGEWVRELIEGRGCELIYLPSYSPRTSTLSSKPSVSSQGLPARSVRSRSHQTLMEVIGEALRTISASDAESFFDHCGYRTVVQSL
jgi:hypothetical protein